MKVSLTGLLHNAASALPARAYAAAAMLRQTEGRLRLLRADKTQGEAAIDTFLGWYMRHAPIATAADLLPKRPTARVLQPGIYRFSLTELAGNLAEMARRKAEGEAVIDEFFAIYVLDEVTR